MPLGEHDSKFGIIPTATLCCMSVACKFPGKVFFEVSYFDDFGVFIFETSSTYMGVGHLNKVLCVLVHII